MDIQTKHALIDYLSHFTTQNKLDVMRAVLPLRTTYVTAVLEDIYQPHNVSAALRSADCFGVQDVYVVEKTHDFSVNVGISKGASQWLTVHRYGHDLESPIARCFECLRERGYCIAATTPHNAACTLDALSLEKPVALVFGTEEVGISDYVKDNADTCVTIQMFGFTESFNISVSVALGLYDLTTRLRSSDIQWGLTEDEKIDVQLSWLRAVVRGSELLEERFLTER